MRPQPVEGQFRNCARILSLVFVGVIERSEEELIALVERRMTKQV